MNRLSDIRYPDDLDESTDPDWFIGYAEMYYSELERRRRDKALSEIAENRTAKAYRAMNRRRDLKYAKRY